MKTFAQVTVDLDDLVSQVPVSKIVKAYGEPEILGHFSVIDIVQRFDNDSLLEMIGEEKIRDFLAHSEKGKIA